MFFRRKKARAEESASVSREELAEVAEGLFSRKGFAGTSVDEIASQAGVSKGVFARYFPRKEDVLVAIGEAGLRAFRAKIAKWASDEKMSPDEKVSRFFGELGSLRQARRTLDWVGVGLAREDPQVHNALMRVALEPLVNDLSAILQEGVARGRFRVTNARATALCLVLTCAEMIHRIGATEKIAPWRQLRESLWEMVSRTIGMTEEQAREARPYK